MTPSSFTAPTGATTRPAADLQTRPAVFGSHLADCGWYEEHGGAVTRVELRRTDNPSEQYHEHRFTGSSIAEADGAYSRWLEERAKVVHRGGERRAKWGPDELRQGRTDGVDELLRECDRVRRQHPGLVAWVEAGGVPIRSDDQHRRVFGCGYEPRPRRVA